MTDRAASIERKAEDSVRKWLTADHARERLAQGNVADSVGPYITLSRETGAGGSEIARLVADQLGWDVLDATIVDYMVSKYGTPRSLVEFADEKRTSWMEDLFSSWIEGRGFTQATYVHRLSRFLLIAAHHGNVVIVGRGATCILPRTRGVSVRILAPIAFRVEQVILQRGLSAKEARKFVEDADRQRDAFVREHFHHEGSDPHLYDLLINVQKFTRHDAAKMIVDATQQWLRDTPLKGFPKSDDLGYAP
jgi:cytidylate kinase